MESVFAADWLFISDDFGRTMLLKGFCGARNLNAAGPTLGKYPGFGRHSKSARSGIVAAKKTATPEQRKYLPRRMKRNLRFAGNAAARPMNIVNLSEDSRENFSRALSRHRRSRPCGFKLQRCLTPSKKLARNSNSTRIHAYTSESAIRSESGQTQSWFRFSETIQLLIT